MKYTYPTKEKLKSRTLINQLFSEGKSVSKYPLRLVYAEVNDLQDTNIKIGVSVSKKHFKKAVDRNYFKRILRESYRLNKDLLHNVSKERNFVFMILYQTKDSLSFQEVNDKTIALFKKFIEVIEKNTQ